MADDMVELIPLSEQDEQIYSDWEAGKGLRTLAREYRLSVTQVEQALDRCLPVFDGATQLRAFKREIRRLEDLSGEFYSIAKRDKCRDSAHLVARLNERICAMRGWSPVNIRMDPYTAETDRGTSSFEKVHEIILEVARRGPNLNGAVDALSPPRDHELDQEPSGGNGSPPAGP